MAEPARRVVARYGAWRATVQRHDVRAFKTVLWGWHVTHVSAGSFASGMCRERDQAEAQARAALEHWARTLGGA